MVVKKKKEVLSHLVFGGSSVDSAHVSRAHPAPSPRLRLRRSAARVRCGQASRCPPSPVLASCAQPSRRTASAAQASRANASWMGRKGHSTTLWSVVGFVSRGPEPQFFGVCAYVYCYRRSSVLWLSGQALELDYLGSNPDFTTVKG